jgi:putative tryptophan/tyrosine transport system substrate-binding protein
MRRREFIRLLSGAAAWPLEVRAQQRTKVPRIGVLSSVGGNTPATRSLTEAFLLGLREHGYVEGESIAIIEQNAEGRLERLPDLAADLVRLNVDLIYATTVGGARAARQATTTIPIVCPNLGDPVGEGLAVSLARPGGNVTGFYIYIDELTAKRLSLLKEAVPAATRVAGLWQSGTMSESLTTSQLESSGASARMLGLELRVVRIGGAEDLDDAFSAMQAERPDALFVFGSPLSFNERRRIAELTMRYRLPSISWTKEHAVFGGLMAYGADIYELRRRSATYIDKILKGAKPADLPIQEPTKFDFVINLKTAKALGLAISPTLLASANEVIE